MRALLGCVFLLEGLPLGKTFAVGFQGCLVLLLKLGATRFPTGLTRLLLSEPGLMCLFEL